MKIGIVPIVPKKLFDINKIQNSIEDALTVGAIGVQSQLEQNTATWEHDVKFYISARPGERTVATQDEIYKYVTGGTRPHIITGRRGNLAFFRTGFVSKTKAGRLGSKAGRRATKNFTRVKSVMHPGTEARDFEGLTVKKWQKKIENLLTQAIKKAV